MLKNCKVSLQQNTVYRLVAMHENESLKNLFKQRGPRLKQFDAATKIFDQLDMQLVPHEIIDKAFEPRSR